VFPHASSFYGERRSEADFNFLRTATKYGDGAGRRSTAAKSGRQSKAAKWCATKYGSEIRTAKYDSEVAREEAAGNEQLRCAPHFAVGGVALLLVKEIERSGARLL